MRKLIVLLLAAVLGMAADPALRAQDTTATISGRVADASGAVLPGAQVVILNVGTGITRTVMTDDAGRYNVPALSLGNYKVTASRDGFQTEARDGITLTLGRQAIVNFDLQVGAVSQVLEVTGEAPLVDTVKGGVGQLVESATIQELPLNGRDLTQLITLQTGAVEYSAYGEQGGRGSTGGKLISVSGGRLTTNVFLMDGIIIESSNQKTPTGVSGNFLGSDGIREFKVESNAYSAEFGRGAGGIFNLATKSGENAFHGSLFEFLRNDNLDAKKWETNKLGARDASGQAIKSPFARNQFGGSFSGPILRDRTFFFGLYEGFRERRGQTIPSSTFTDAAKRTPGIDPRAAQYLSLWPSPNGSPRDSFTADYIFDYSTPVNEDFYQIRGDHHFSEADSFFMRYSFSKSKQELPFSFPEYTNKVKNTNHFVTIEDTHIFSPMFLVSFRAGFSRTNPLELSQNPDVNPSLLFNPAFPQLGAIVITNGPSSIGNGTTGGGLTNNSFQYVADARYIRGAHSTKFGFNWNTIQFMGWLPGRDAGDYTFGSVANFFAANSSRFRGAISSAYNDAYRSMSQEINGLYFQDDYQVTPRLTLNLGLRYEFIRIPRERYGRLGNFRGDHDWLLQAKLSDITTGSPWIENPSKKNFAPRIGFAYDVFGNQKTALRGGIGIFHLQFSHTWWRTTVFRMPPFLIETQATPKVVNGVNVPVPFPDIFRLCGNENPASPSDPRCSGAPAPDFPEYKFSTPYAMQYNLTLQHQINSDTTVSVGYVGSRGIRLPSVADVNVAFATFVNGRATFPVGSRPNKNFDDLRMRYPGADSFYNSMQLSLQRRLKKGWQYGLSYTWSRNVDDISGNQTASDTNTGVNWITYYPDKGMYRGLSSYDIRHVMSLNSIYELPIGQGKAIGSSLPKWFNAAVGGWQMSGVLSLAGGVPGTVDAAPAGGMTGSGVRQQFPDLVAGASTNPIKGESAGCTFSFVNGSPERSGIVGPFNPGAPEANSVKPGTKLGTAERYFDPCAFTSAPSPQTLGSLGRNTVILPGRATVDLTLSKSITVTEATKVQFRAEAYNLFNHPNLGIPVLNSFDNVRRNNADAGRITSTSTSARQIQFGLKLTF